MQTKLQARIEQFRAKRALIERQSLILEAELKMIIWVIEQLEKDGE